MAVAQLGIVRHHATIMELFLYFGGTILAAFAVTVLFWIVMRHWATAKSNTRDLARLLNRLLLVEILMLGCATVAFGWIGAAMVLIFGDTELRPVFRILWYLWLWLAFVPLCGFGVCWCWRLSLKRKIGQILHDTKAAA